MRRTNWRTRRSAWKRSFRREAEFSALNILLGQVHSESDKLVDAKADLEARAGVMPRFWP